MSVYLGTEGTLAFGSFFTQIISMGWSGASRDEIDVTPRGAAVYKSKIPGSYIDGGQLTCEFQFTNATTPPLAGAIASAVLTAGDGTTSIVLTADAFMTAFDFNAPDQDQLTATGVLTLTGTVTVT